MMDNGTDRIGHLYSVLAKITHDRVADPALDKAARDEAAEVAAQATDAALRRRSAGDAR